VRGRAALGIGLRDETPRAVAEIGARTGRWSLECHTGARDHAILFVSYFDDWVMCSTCPNIIYRPVPFQNNDPQGGLCQGGSGTE
jgi:hypothetical protein